MVKNIDQTVCIISGNKYTIIRVVEAIICSMFNVKQFRMTQRSGMNIKFKFNDIRTRNYRKEINLAKLCSSVTHGRTMVPLHLSYVNRASVRATVSTASFTKLHPAVVVRCARPRSRGG